MTPSEFTVRGDGIVFAFRSDGYQLPDPQNGSDADWLLADVELTLSKTGTFCARHDVWLFTPDLVSFRDALRALDQKLSGEVRLEHKEDQVQVAITLTAGRGTVAGFVREHGGATLGFEHYAIDQTYIRDALTELESFLEKFPARGDPRGR